MSDLYRLVEQGDLDGLIALVDRLAVNADWSELVRLRDASRAAVERGKQLWAAAALAEYRLALDAPGAWAAEVLDSQAARFTPGPFPEVAASTKGWVDLADHLSASPGAAAFAHERVVRGDDLRDDDLARRLPPVLDLPLVLQPWEPDYPCATYRPDGGEFPSPPFPSLSPLSLPARSPDRLAADSVVRALAELAHAWTAGSNGRVDAACVEGDAALAIRAIGPPTARAARVDSQVALAHLAWTGANGGAHGRRRGMSYGRFATWWVLAALAGLEDEWPVEPEELGLTSLDVRWYLWDGGDPDTGWSVRIAIEDPIDGLSWALAALDAAS